MPDVLMCREFAWYFSQIVRNKGMRVPDC